MSTTSEFQTDFRLNNAGVTDFCLFKTPPNRVLIHSIDWTNFMGKGRKNKTKLNRTKQVEILRNNKKVTRIRTDGLIR
jgi:hypothetical protein